MVDLFNNKLQNCELVVEKWSDLIDYEYAFDFMKSRADELRDGKGNSLLWLLEHKDVFTRGYASSDDEILNKNTDIQILDTNRGGKTTYHGKGQRVVYLICELSKIAKKDIKNYINIIEQIVIESIRNFNINGYRKNGMNGVWVKNGSKEQKISAVGVRLSSKWIVSHGFSLNVDVDIDKFSQIIPCGIKEYGVCSFKSLGIDVDLDLKNRLDRIIVDNFKKIDI